jgi:purine nucleosidase
VLLAHLRSDGRPSALYVLLSSPDVDVVGVYVTPGDTILKYAVPAIRALLARFRLKEVPIGAPRARDQQPNPGEAIDGDSSPNAFPEDFRLDGKRLWMNSSLKEVPAELWPPVDHSETFLQDLLLRSHDVVYLATGPLTTLAGVLKARPDVIQHIARVVWMGGAVDVMGNVEELSPKAEWNVYADPASAQYIWQLPASVPIWMMPLDATNALPLTRNFLYSLSFACPDSFISEAYHATAQKTQYYFWDVATVVWLLRPELIESSVIQCSVADNGVTYRDEESGRSVLVAFRLNASEIYAWLSMLCVEESRSLEAHSEL